MKKTEAAITNQLNIIGSNLRLARKCQNLSMQQVAEATGLCRQTISDVENGRGKIGLETYLLVAEAVGADLSANVRPQILRRSTKQVNIVDKCRGMTSDGIPFIICANPAAERKMNKTNHHEKSRCPGSGNNDNIILFTYHDKKYEIPFEQIIINTSTRSKPLYYFSASAAVQQAVRKINFIENAGKLNSHERNIRPET